MKKYRWSDEEMNKGELIVDGEKNDTECKT